MDNTRLLTLDEVRNGNFNSVWAEIYTGLASHYSPEGIRAFGESMGWKEYGSFWRCWTEQPNEEDRKAVEWDD